MKIVELRAENFKRLKAVHIKPDGALVRIHGNNGEGKSSILDSIWAVLGGRAAAPAEPIRKGCERAKIQLSTGELTAERSFTAGEHGTTTTLRVLSHDGRQLATPQNVLNALVGDLAFDPLEFTRLDPKKQFEVLKRFVTGFDFEAHAQKRKKFYDDRTEANRLAKDSHILATKQEMPPDGRPPKEEPAPLAELLQVFTEARDKNEAIATEERTREAAQADIDADMDRAERLRADAVSLEKAAAKRQCELDNLPSLPEPVDMEPIRHAVETSETAHRYWLAHKRRLEHQANAKEAEKAASDCTIGIEALDKEKAQKIAAAKMPVAGLGFAEDDTVTFNGLPLSQASQAEQIRTSVAIGMHLNPKLRVMLIREGSLLDAKSLAMLETMVREADYQCWIERVGADGGVGFEIVDGEIVG